jgi:hypothetical protein
MYFSNFGNERSSEFRRASSSKTIRVFNTPQKIDSRSASRDGRADEEENGEWGTSKVETHPNNEREQTSQNDQYSMQHFNEYNSWGSQPRISPIVLQSHKSFGNLALVLGNPVCSGMVYRIT